MIKRTKTGKKTKKKKVKNKEEKVINERIKK